MRLWIWVYVVVSAGSCSSPPSPLPPPLPSCVELFKAEQWAAAAERCSQELATREDPTIRLYTTKVLRYLGRCEEADRNARPLIPGPHAADAELVLGGCALARNDLRTAEQHLERAMSMHGEAGKFAEQARDAQQLSGVRFRQGEYKLALQVLELSHAAATRANDDQMKVFVEMSAAQILRAIGDLRGAEQRISRALDQARDPGDRALAHFMRGLVQMEQGLVAPARSTLEGFLAVHRGAPTPQTEFVAAALLNLASLDRKAGTPAALAEALGRVEDARRFGIDEMEYRLNRGIILGDLGRLAEATADLRAAEAAGPPGEWSWWVPYQAALVATKAGDVEGAIAAGRRSIAKVTELATRSGAYGPTVIASLRQPHVHLIGLLAKRQAWREVLNVVTTLDAHALLDSREAPSDVLPSSASPLVPPAPTRRPLGEASAVLDAWRGRRLVIVVPGGDRIWRLVMRDGALDGRDLGEAAPLEKRARALEVSPDDAEVGRILGEAILGGLTPDGPIDLLVMGQLARAPLAALRIGGRRTTADYRLARVPGVLPWKTAAGVPRAPARAVVIGDPTADLPASAGEATRIAKRLGVEPYLRAAATHKAFETASGAPLLHFSGHTEQDLDGAALLLADRRIRPGDIAKLLPGPRRVVLASCAAKVGRDEVGSGSIANAFLDAGADHVVATRWTIDDHDAAPLVSAFYELGGDRDPVRALAAAQQRLAGRVQVRTWAAFEVIASRPTMR